MVRRLLLPVLGLALFLTEAATAQNLPAKPVKPAAAVPQKSPVTGRTLTARERRAAEAAAKKAASADAAMAMATPATASAAQPGWTGWSDEPVNLPQDDVLYHPRTNLSVAPGMPVNQVGHGVTTDYHGRPLPRTAPAAATSRGTTITAPR
jgi:hypothetical protein